MSSQRIQKAKLSDVESIAEVEYNCFRPSLCFSLNSIRYHVKNNLVLISRDLHSGIVCGYICISPLTRLKQRRVYSVAVHPDWQGKGIASSLMDHGEKRAKAKSIILEVDETNKAAISVYRKRGYETFGYYPGYYGKTGALRMKKVF